MANPNGKITINVEVKNVMKGMVTCKVCGRDFPLMVEEHYISRDGEKKGVMPALNGQEEPKMYDTYDCPHCGSQFLAQERKQLFSTEADIECPCDYGICSECEKEDGDE